MIQGSVEILYYNDNADDIVASAGRISTTKGGAKEIYEKSGQKTREENIQLIRKILSSGHQSVLEHICLNLAFNQVSVFVEQFMIEFRLASFTVKSRRYVDFGKMGYVMPDFDSYRQNENHIREIYQQHMEYLFDTYQNLLDHEVPKEDARFVLPYGFRSNFYCTVNARELVRIVDEMVWGRGKDYPELVNLGKSLIGQCQGILPFLDFGRDEDAGQKSEVGSLAREGRGRAFLDDTEELAVLLRGPEKPEEMICGAAIFQQGIQDWRLIEEDADFQKTLLKGIMLQSRRRELEQVNFTILFPRLSLAGVTHLVRHRMQSVVIPNYRNICDYEKYVLPESIVKSGLKEKYEEAFQKSKAVRQELRAAGFSGSDCVYLLLSGMTIPVMTTMNGNELLTLIQLRTCNRAQWEIREHVTALLKILRRRYPVLFSLYGPACYMTGKCPEGRMSCGQAEEMKRVFETDLIHA